MSRRRGGQFYATWHSGRADAERARVGNARCDLAAEAVVRICRAAIAAVERGDLHFGASVSDEGAAAEGNRGVAVVSFRIGGAG